MEWLKKLSLAIDYIENNLAGDIPMMKLQELPAARPITFNVCFHK